MIYDDDQDTGVGLRDIVCAWMLVAALLLGLIVFSSIYPLASDHPGADTAGFTQSARYENRLHILDAMIEHTNNATPGGR